MKRSFVLLFGLGAVLGCAILGVWLYNQQVLQKPMERVIVNDPRNHVVHPSVHFDGWVDTSTVVFDLVEIDGNASQTDVFRVFLQYAREQQGRHFEKVVLAAYGQKKFELSGNYFQQLGREFDAQNPVYTVRTFSHHVRGLDGSKPFPEYEGGLLGVFAKEMEQFSELNKRWYLDDFTARHK